MIGSHLRCERIRAYSHLLGRARQELELARLQRFSATSAAVRRHWSRECTRWFRVVAYLRRRLAAFETAQDDDGPFCRGCDKPFVPPYRGAETCTDCLYRRADWLKDVQKNTFSGP